MGSSVVATESVDSGFDENKSELRIDVFSVLFQVLSNGYSLLNHGEEIFRDRGSTTVLLKNS